MSRYVVVSALVVLACGCVDARAARLRAAQGATLAVDPVTPLPLAPKTGLVLASPSACAVGGGGDSALAVWLVCMGVVTVVDVAALAPLAIIRHREARDVADLEALCPLEDPAVRAAEIVERRLVAELGFVRPAAPEGGEAGQVGPAPAERPRAAVRLRVETKRFGRAGGVTWQSVLALRDLHGGTLFETACDEGGVRRSVADIARHCPEARDELELLAARCAAAFVDALGRELTLGPASPGVSATPHQPGTARADGRGD